MVRRAQMQKQLDMSSTEADKLLKKAGKMNDQLFNGGGAVTKIIRESRETIEEPEKTISDRDRALAEQAILEETGKTISDRDRATMQGLMSLEERDNIIEAKRLPPARDPYEDRGGYDLPEFLDKALGMKGGGSVASEEYYAEGGAAKKQKRGKSNKHGAFSKGPGQGAMVKGTNFRGIF